MAVNTTVDPRGAAESLLVGVPSAVAEALSSLCGVPLQAESPQFYEGAASELPLPRVEHGWTVLPIQETTGHHMALLLTRTDAAVLLQSLLGDAEAVAPDALGELHKTALCEALSQVVFRVQEYFTVNLHVTVALQAGREVEDDLQHMGQTPVLAIGFPLTAQSPGLLAAPAGIEARTLTGPVYVVVEKKLTQILKSASTPHRAPVSPLPRGHFPQLDPGAAPAPQNLHLVLDIQLQMVAVLGRRTIQLKDLLTMGPGAVLELERLAGDPLELIVNGKLVGYGEVIVVDDKLSIRVRELVQPRERLQSVNL